MYLKDQQQPQRDQKLFIRILLEKKKQKQKQQKVAGVHMFQMKAVQKPAQGIAEPGTGFPGSRRDPIRPGGRRVRVLRR